MVAPEGQALLSFLPFFGSGKFMREEMQAVAGATGRQSAASREEPEPNAEESADYQHKQTVDRGLGQLERAGLIEFDQGRGLYTFHQTLLDHVVRQSAMDPDRARSGRLALLAFHADYVRDHSDDDEAINRCVENILSTLESAWGLREEESSLDLTICFVINRLGNYFGRRGLWRVGEHWLERAIALRRSSTVARDQVALSQGLYQLAQILFQLGEHAEARNFLRESIAVNEELGNRRGRAASLHQLAMIEHAQGNPAEARGLLRESIAVNEELGDRQGRAASLHQLAIIERAQGNPAGARRLLRESIAVLEELGNRRGRAACLHLLAIIEHDQGNPAEARRLLREAISAFEEVGDRQGRAASLHVLAMIEHDQGNPAEARRLLLESIAVLEELGDRQGRAASLHVLAIIESTQGNRDEARRLWEESIEIDREIGNSTG